MGCKKINGKYEGGNLHPMKEAFIYEENAA